MRNQPNRLSIEARHHLWGSAIDRSAPLRFRLDGRVVHGLAGDTVLSALLASGIDIVGLRAGQPMGLNSRFAPAIADASLSNDPRHALPMERVPAIDGADLRTLAGPTNSLPVLGPLLRPARSLGLDLDKSGALAQPWLDLGPGETIAADMVVVGGGVAGLSAALAAADAGRRVIVLEASPITGGLARLFGALGDEESPDDSIVRLRQAVAAAETVDVMVAAEAFAARPGLVRAHLVNREGDSVTGQVVDYRAPAIILATGTLERLPLFAGNRLPGIVGVAEAFIRADRYGIAAGRSALFATASSAAYRLAMLMGDAGVGITRILDARNHPQSRFVEFCKAYGFTQAPGTIVLHAEMAGAKKGLAMALQSAMEEARETEDAPRLAADSLIVSGGWQPDLTLWHMAGGQSRWNGETGRIEPTEGPAGIALAGSAAGWISKQAAMQSGEDAVARLLGLGRREVVEYLVDPIYESADGPAPVSTAPPVEEATTFLDFGTSLIARPVPPAPGWRRFVPFAPAPPAWSLADQPQALGVCDVAAGVQLGAIPAASAGIVAAERSAFNGNLIDAAGLDIPAALHQAPLLPDFLHGRFGPGAIIRVVTPEEPRQLEAGTPIFANPDETDPRQAIGVVLGSENAVFLALLRGPEETAPLAGTLRDQGRAVPVRLGVPSGAPLGGDAGTP